VWGLRTGQRAGHSAGGALAPLGVSWSRIDVGFEGSDANGPEYNCPTGAFDLTALDQRVAAARVAGASPLLLVWTTRLPVSRGM
jgi:hypothetical protein